MVGHCIYSSQNITVLWTVEEVPARARSSSSQARLQDQGHHLSEYTAEVSSIVAKLHIWVKLCIYKIVLLS